MKNRTRLIVIIFAVIIVLICIALLFKFIIGGIDLISCILDIKQCSVTYQTNQTKSDNKQSSKFVFRKPFKFTVSTNVETRSGKVEMLIAMNPVYPYSVEYDLDCDGDGEYEYLGLTENQKCVYDRKSGMHQIWIRGDIPAMYLCARRPQKTKHHPSTYILVLPMMADFVSEIYEQACENVNSLDDINDESVNSKVLMHYCMFPVDNSRKNKAKVVSIDDWGDIKWRSMTAFALDCTELTKIPKDAPDLKYVNNMALMFGKLKRFNQSLKNWDVSNVTDMSLMFYGAETFNQPLENWDVSHATNMSGMFFGASSFNQPLENWDVSHVTNMSEMFFGASSFNQPLEKWDVSHVTNMSGMLFGASSYNQPLEKWDISNITDKREMFKAADSYNQPINDIKDVILNSEDEGD